MSGIRWTPPQATMKPSPKMGHSEKMGHPDL